MLLVLCNKSTECSDHGTCGDDGKCLCHDGYFGTDCSSKLIFLKIKTIPIASRAFTGAARGSLHRVSVVARGTNITPGPCIKHNV